LTGFGRLSIREGTEQAREFPAKSHQVMQQFFPRWGVVALFFDPDARNWLFDYNLTHSSR